MLNVKDKKTVDRVFEAMIAKGFLVFVAPGRRTAPGVILFLSRRINFMQTGCSTGWRMLPFVLAAQNGFPVQ